MSSQELVSGVFAGVALLYLAAIATYLIVRKRGDHLPPQASFIVGFLCAVAGAFCGYFFTGALGFTFDIPGTGIKGTAAGGFGGFVLLMLLWRLEERAAAKERKAAQQAAAKENEAAQQAAAKEKEAAQQATAKEYEDKTKREAEKEERASQAAQLLMGRPSSNHS
jgi:hypothetical protein